MPFIKVYYNDSLSDNETDLISKSIHDSLMNNFEVPEDDIFHLFLPYKDKQFVFNENYKLSVGKARTNKMIYVDILCGNGRSSLQKEKLFLSIATNISKSIEVNPADIFITIKESSRENWSFGEGVAQLIEKGGI
ncbi:tautomerase family protein [Clostridium sp.]|uniref:tautomerase family protein n=1 Tax=Clostridium sp. TaxID=1506 RepID=UPI002841ABD8|nr:tautomerase family protein [Clostridium sp.]MDR3595657.1 tautomerase family protein [Clostridium sp.]